MPINVSSHSDAWRDGLAEFARAHLRRCSVSRVAHRILALWAAWLLFRPSLYRILYLLSERTRLLQSLKGTDIGSDALLPGDFFHAPASFQALLGLRHAESELVDGLE